MPSLRAAPPRPRQARVAPSYPRAIATFAVLLAGCGGIVENEGRPDPMPDPAGGISFPFDAEPPPDTEPPPDAAPDAKDAGQPETSPEPMPDPGGAAPMPFEDAGPEEVGAEDAGPAPEAEPK